MQHTQDIRVVMSAGPLGLNALIIDEPFFQRELGFGTQPL